MLSEGVLLWGLCKVTKNVTAVTVRCDEHHTANVGNVEPEPTNTENSATTTEISIPIFTGVFKLILYRDGFGESV